MPGERIDQLQRARRVDVQHHVVQRKRHHGVVRIKQQLLLDVFVLGKRQDVFQDSIFDDPSDRTHRFQSQQRIGRIGVEELIQLDRHLRRVGHRDVVDPRVDAVGVVAVAIEFNRTDERVGGTERTTAEQIQIAGVATSRTIARDVAVVPGQNQTARGIEHVKRQIRPAKSRDVIQVEHGRKIVVDRQPFEIIKVDLELVEIDIVRIVDQTRNALGQPIADQRIGRHTRHRRDVIGRIIFVLTRVKRRPGVLARRPVTDRLGGLDRAVVGRHLVLFAR